MTYPAFDKLLEKMIAEEKAIGLAKGKEYTKGKDRLDNFKRLAKELDISPLKVLWIYASKHINSITSFIKIGKTLSEPIEGRIMDLRVYLSLLRGMIEDK